MNRNREQIGKQKYTFSHCFYSNTSFEGEAIKNVVRGGGAFERKYFWDKAAFDNSDFFLHELH